MGLRPLRAGHVDHCWELAPGCCVITGWCTDSGPDACLELVHSEGVQVLPLGDPRVHRPDVCDALGISREWGEKLGFLVAASIPPQSHLLELNLAGRSVAWRPEGLDVMSPNRVILRCLDALNWGCTPLEDLQGYLHGALGTVLEWINRPAPLLHCPAVPLQPEFGPGLSLYLPACSELVWIQIWRLALYPKTECPASLSIHLEARASAFGDPEQIVADLFKSWLALGLPEPTITISLASSATSSSTERNSLVVDGRRWLLPLEPWWKRALQAQSKQRPELPDETLLQLGFTPIDWTTLSSFGGIADQWAWQLEIDQWLQDQ